MAGGSSGFSKQTLDDASPLTAAAGCFSPPAQGAVLQAALLVRLSPTASSGYNVAVLRQECTCLGAGCGCGALFTAEQLLATQPPLPGATGAAALQTDFLLYATLSTSFRGDFDGASEFVRQTSVNGNEVQGQCDVQQSGGGVSFSDRRRSGGGGGGGGGRTKQCPEQSSSCLLDLDVTSAALAGLVPPPGEVRGSGMTVDFSTSAAVGFCNTSATFTLHVYSLSLAPQNGNENKTANGNNSSHAGNASAVAHVPAGGGAAPSGSFGGSVAGSYSMRWLVTACAPDPADATKCRLHERGVGGGHHPAAAALTFAPMGCAGCSGLAPGSLDRLLVFDGNSTAAPLLLSLAAGDANPTPAGLPLVGRGRQLLLVLLAPPLSTSSFAASFRGYPIGGAGASLSLRATPPGPVVFEGSLVGVQWSETGAPGPDLTVTLLRGPRGVGSADSFKIVGAATAMSGGGGGGGGGGGFGGMCLWADAAAAAALSSSAGQDASAALRLCDDNADVGDEWFATFSGESARYRLEQGRWDPDATPTPVGAGSSSSSSNSNSAGGGGGGNSTAGKGAVVRSGWCLGVLSVDGTTPALAVPGANVGLVPCSTKKGGVGSNANVNAWKFTAKGAGAFLLALPTTAAAAGGSKGPGSAGYRGGVLCLDARGASAVAGTNLQLGVCTGEPDQGWVVADYGWAPSNANTSAAAAAAGADAANANANAMQPVPGFVPIAVANNGSFVWNVPYSPAWLNGSDSPAFHEADRERMYALRLTSAANASIYATSAPFFLEDGPCSGGRTIALPAAGQAPPSGGSGSLTISDDGRYEDGSYEPYSNCWWRVVAPAGHVVQLRWVSLSLEPGGSDYVAVYDGGSAARGTRTLEKYYNQSSSSGGGGAKGGGRGFDYAGTTVTSSGAEMYVAFLYSRLLTHSLTHSLTRSLTHSLAHSLTHSLTHSLLSLLHHATRYVVFHSDGTANAGYAGFEATPSAVRLGAGTLTVTKPAGALPPPLLVGRSMDIRWTSTGALGAYVRIDLVAEGAPSYVRSLSLLRASY